MTGINGRLDTAEEKLSAIWIDAKNSEFRKQKKIKITKDLTQCVKDARAKLWPLVEEAILQKKIAGFKGPFAIIDGKRISVDDLN